MVSEEEIKQNISGQICSKCGGEAPDWKCPKCGKVSHTFDPMHWRNCLYDAKMQAQCKVCGEAEENCICLSHGNVDNT